MSYQKITSTTVLTAPTDSTQINTMPLVIECDSTSAAFTVTLPVLSTFTYPYGVSYIFHDLGGVAATNPITIAAGSGDEVNNAASVLLNSNDQTVTVRAVGGTDWSASYSNGAMPQVAITANADGLTTAIVPNGNCFVTVTSANSTDLVTLPAPIPGTVVWFKVGANGFKLRSNAPATVAINGGTGASASSAVATTITLRLICVSATQWISTSFTTAGVVAAGAVAS